MTDKPITDARESAVELAILVAELNVHTMHLRGEIARLIDLIAEDREARRKQSE